MLNGCIEKQSSNKQETTLITETHGTLKVQNNWQKKLHGSYLLFVQVENYRKGWAF